MKRKILFGIILKVDFQPTWQLVSIEKGHPLMSIA